MRVGFARLHPRASLPRRMSAGAAGLDLFACVPEVGAVELGPGARALIPTGLQMQLPLDYEAQVRPRSGLALRHGVTVLNSPGTLDADYRGEIGVLLVNLGSDPFVVQHGDRVAQLVIAPVVPAEPVEVAVQSPTPGAGRGGAGFGSTGGFGARPPADPPTGFDPSSP